VVRAAAEWRQEAFTRRAFLIALVGAVLVASPAAAKPGKGKGKD
jgi:hypothetical protein